MKDVDQSLNSSKSIGPLIFSPEHIASWSLTYSLVFNSCYWWVQILPNTVVLLPGETFSYCRGKYDSYLIEHLKRIICALISCPIRALQNKLMRLTIMFPWTADFSDVATEGQGPPQCPGDGVPTGLQSFSTEPHGFYDYRQQTLEESHTQCGGDGEICGTQNGKWNTVLWPTAP